MFEVIVIHSSAGNNPFQLFLLNFCDLAVPCFILLSGAMALSNDRNIKSLNFYKKTWKKIALPYIAICFLYLLESWAFGVFGVLVKGESAAYEWKEPISQWIQYGYPPRGYHLWYMYIAVALYMLTPLLFRIRNKNKKIYHIVAVTFFGMQFIFAKYLELPWYLKFLQFIGLFMLGDIIKSNKHKIKSNIVKIIVIVFSLLEVLKYLLQIYKVYYGSNVFLDMIQENHLLQLLLNSSTLAVMLFLLFTCYRTNKSYYHIAKYSYGVYLIHILIGDILVDPLLVSDYIGLGLDRELWWMSSVKTILLLTISIVGLKILEYLKYYVDQMRDNYNQDNRLP